MAQLTSTAAVNAAVGAAKDLPDLTAKLAAIDPTLAQQITGQALVTAKGPLGVLLTTGIAYEVAKLGLGWSQGFDEAVAGAVLLAAAYVARYLTTHPISGLLRPKVAPPAA